jgi:superfamily II DNA/RNA helicase
MVRLCTEPYPANSRFEEHFELFPFPLSDFQKYAIEAILTGNHVLITAHTGSGKTLPAEFAIEHFVKKGKKVIYTSPIKALSNQKYFEFQRKYPHISFGLLTGDIKTNPDADVLIMTTEILMNALFIKGGDTKQNPLAFQLDIDVDLACVVFDEVHYINDADRGQTWEKTILMLPRHIQMVMLSATIDAPERFAKWCERDDTSREVYLASTTVRQVSLTHYGYLTVPESAIKLVKDKALEKEIRESTHTLIPLHSAAGVFQENGYRTLAKTCKTIDIRQISVKRKHVLNNLCMFLKDRDMLPAIGFVFSRKQVELCAHEITVPLLEDDSKVGYTVRRECEQIVRKLPNFQEYLELPEYVDLVGLLEKGIGIHHSGMIPILREIVELLISKRYIKVLFATESFAIGLDCPIKTAIFTGLHKFDGQTERLLMSHEYTQMAGRAGRRGIDTIGHVVHCNNLFGLPTATEYRGLLGGGPQELVSKFRISYSLVLNLSKTQDPLGRAAIQGMVQDPQGQDQEGLGSSIGDFAKFVKQSMMYDDLQSSMRNQVLYIAKKMEERDQLAARLGSCITPIEVSRRILEIQEGIKTAVNKKRKEYEKELSKIKEEYPFYEPDLKIVQKYDAIVKEITEDQDELAFLETYVEDQVERLCLFMVDRGFFARIETGEANEEPEHTRYMLTDLGKTASSIAEIHPLITAQLMHRWSYFREFTTCQIVGLMALYTDVKVLEKRSFPHSNDSFVKGCVQEVSDLYREYEDAEGRYQLRTGIQYYEALNYDMPDLAMQWTQSSTELECKGFVQSLTYERGISVGDFTKAMLKISTISKEWIKLLDGDAEHVECLHKLSQIDGLILKYITTAQSLYV